MLIRDNPDPLFIPIAATGSKPVLETEKTTLDFGRLLVKNKDTQYLVLHNRSPLDLAWKIAGIEGISDISIPQLSGVIEASQSFKVPATFEAHQPVVHKKIVRLEVTDTSNVLGILQSIPITVLAEAYAAAVDLNFPKGSVSQLNFGILRVFEDVKQNLTLKNKGKYNMNFKFSIPNGTKMFTVTPMDGTVSPNEKTLNISVGFKAEQEVCTRDDVYTA